MLGLPESLQPLQRRHCHRLRQWLANNLIEIEFFLSFLNFPLYVFIYAAMHNNNTILQQLKVFWLNTLL